MFICGSLLFAAGCGTRPENSSFPLSVSAADKELVAIQAERKPLSRPVVVIDGYLDPGLGSAVVANWVRKLTPDEKQVVTVSLLTTTNFDACRQKIVAAVEEAFPSDDPAATQEVDVIGLSMGGLAARYAALPAVGERPATLAATAVPATTLPPTTVPTSTVSTTASSAPEGAPSSAPSTDPAELLKPTGKRLRIARLFTLSSPHQGAAMADVPTYLFISTQRDMRRGSTFLQQLNDAGHTPDYPIIPYVRLADLTVGEQNAAPPGQIPIWLPKGPFDAAHAGVVMDPRIAADVSRRLRGEASYVKEPRAPLPD
ncbi:lipase family protein [Humisphaera borealis]|uniref:Alpha/beta hydrolase n=1 Tax=Humisphaera borealis TaxID=2807512 RepID=A0A7M2WVK8_9BACT|nr:hypothetical protein [Humisphaera borealis]QOV89496.1 hypothetical protein IPV69_25430 [Humisphaera borealis]